MKLFPEHVIKYVLDTAEMYGPPELGLLNILQYLSGPALEAAQQAISLDVPLEHMIEGGREALNWAYPTMLKGLRSTSNFFPSMFNGVRAIGNLPIPFVGLIAVGIGVVATVGAMVIYNSDDTPPEATKQEGDTE